MFVSRQVLVIAAGEQAELLQDVLADAGYRVVTAADPRSAHAALRSLAAPALVLLDDAPEAALVEFLAAVRRLRPADLAALPVVLLRDGSSPAPAGVAEIVGRALVPPLLLEVVQRLLEQAG